MGTDMSSIIYNSRNLYKVLNPYIVIYALERLILHIKL